MKKVEVLYVFLGIDKATEAEGILVTRGPDGYSMPLIAFNDKYLEQMKMTAKQIADVSRKSVRLAKFTTREDIETFVPVPVVRIATGVENA